MTTCPFCAMPPARIVAANRHGMVVRDAFPVSPGHTLVIAQRHVGSFFELGKDEREGLLELLDEAKRRIRQTINQTPTTSASTTAPPPGRPCRTCTST